MSLVQHVSALEGTDRELAPDDPDDFHPIRRKISYDVIQPSQAVSATAQPVGIPAYKQSTIKRIGKPSSPVASPALTSKSPGHNHDYCVLARVRHRIRLRSTQASTH